MNEYGDVFGKLTPSFSPLIYNKGGRGDKENTKNEKVFPACNTFLVFPSLEKRGEGRFFYFSI